MSITYKALALLVIPALTLCGAVYYAAQTAAVAMQQSVQRAAQTRAEAIMDEIDREIHNRIAEWSAYGRTRLVQQTLVASNKECAARPDRAKWIKAQDDAWTKASRSKSSPLIQQIVGNDLSTDLRLRVAKLHDGFQYPIYGEIFFTNKYGVNAALTQITSDYRQDDEEWWTKAEKAGVSINDVGFDESAEVYSVDLGLRIDDESSAMIGVAKIVLNLRAITELVDARGVGGRGNPATLTLLSGKNQVIRTTADPMKPLADGLPLLGGIDFSQSAPVFSVLRTNPQTGAEVVTAVARSRGFGRNPGVPWTLLLEQQAAVALAPLDYVKRHVIFTMTIGLSISILLSGLIVRGVVKRIRLLEAAAQRVGSGEYGLSVSVSGSDEIGRLGHSFNKMSTNLAHAATSLADANQRLSTMNEELAERADALSDKQRILEEQADELQTTQAALEEQNAKLEVQTEQLKHAKTTAEEANRAKSAFLANMSHEIRTPMTAILGYIDLLTSSSLNAEEGREAVDTVQRNGQHLLALINDILDLSKIESGKLEIESVACPIPPLLNEVCDLLRLKAAQKGLTLDLRMNGPVPLAIRSDPVRLRQGLVNLVGNAIKFTEHGGISVVVQCDPKSERITFHVTDTGIGIAVDQTEHVFEAFCQGDASTTRRFGGTGLGLTITRAIARLLGGDVVATSKPGLGSTFSLTVATGSLAGVQMVSRLDAPIANCGLITESAVERLTGVRILLVEDGPDNRRLIALLLQRSGATVDTAENGEEGIQQALVAWSDGQPYDVILMDIQMPVVDGYEATLSLRDAGYTWPIVALTANAMKGTAERCLSAGCDAYLSKPIDRHTLVAEISSRVAEARRNQRLEAAAPTS